MYKMGKSSDSAAADCGCCCVGIADGRVPDSAFLGYILPWLRYDTGVCRTAAAGFPDSGSVSSIGFCADPRASLRCVPGVSALLTESEGRNGALAAFLVALVAVYCYRMLISHAAVLETDYSNSVFIESFLL